MGYEEKLYARRDRVVGETFVRVTRLDCFAGSNGLEKIPYGLVGYRSLCDSWGFLCHHIKNIPE